jgi:hypothetical protein
MNSINEDLDELGRHSYSPFIHVYTRSQFLAAGIHAIVRGRLRSLMGDGSGRR